MLKKLDRLQWKPMWVSHLGSVKGGLEYLNIPVSEAWLMGMTGHAFLINLDDKVTAAGPTAWNNEMLMNLGSNLGYETHGVFGWRTEADFTAKQKLAWENTKKAIDQGYPCYGWELGIPEYYVVNGYDEHHGYRYSGIGTADPLFLLEGLSLPDLERFEMTVELRSELEQHGIAVSERTEVSKKFGSLVFEDALSSKLYYLLQAIEGHWLVHEESLNGAFKPWQELGISQNGLLEMYWLEPGFTTDDREALKEALEFVLEFSKGASQWILPGYKVGIDGFDQWIGALSERRADGFGTAYNAAVWSECRKFAVECLKEAEERIGRQGSELNGLLQAGAQHYGQVYHYLSKVEKLFPFHQREEEHIRDEDRLNQAVEALTKARDAEEQALNLLRAIYNKLS
ncbi:hypothetical protein [Paenibacillus sp. J2TS4]|uniref:hypothetical protein n=1 Tax=Paenibacillus sp. J2TS4 TaxID=2807194 RepID=UPI001AFFFEC0|nr:hypothetical protein [Paenibacillus sp. J2TS4]GIP36150.1 hypothetical protein J2TS4_53600 [Paenibacillus sp. J2TS4]